MDQNVVRESLYTLGDGQHRASLLFGKKPLPVAVRPVVEKVVPVLAAAIRDREVWVREE